VTISLNSGAVNINVLANDTTAPDTGETLTIVSFTQPLHGTLSLVNGIFVYTPNNGFTGMDTFTYTISDGNAIQNAGQATGTVTINVTGLTSGPIISAPGTITTPRQGVLPLTGPNRITISDTSNGNISVTLQVSTGTLKIGDLHGLTRFTGNNTSSITLVGTQSAINHALGSLQFRPISHFLGTAVLTITAQDVNSNGGATSALTTDTVNIVYVKNHAPVPNPRFVHLPFVDREGRVLVVSSSHGLLTRVLDVDRQILTFRLVGRPNVGAVRLLPHGAFRFIAPHHFHGKVHFVVRAFDGFIFSRPIIINIFVR
jgi:large repetitive protein